jgi:hypothetical protein
MKILIAYAVATALLALPMESLLIITRIPSYSKRQRHNISIATTSPRYNADQRQQVQTTARRKCMSPRFLSSNNQQQYDLSKPVFDLYAGRQVRGDALAKYNTLNQSEPLRINLAAFGVLFFLALPALLEEVARDGVTTGISSSTTASLVGDGVASSVMSSSLPLAPMLACYASAVASAVVFWQQKSRRSRQLTRFEKELKAVALSIRLPNNILADRRYGNVQTIRALQQSSTLRLIAVSGNKHELRSALQELQVLANRLVQSSTYVVVVATDGSKESDWGLANDSKSSKRAWLVQPGDPEEWQLYFASLSSPNSNSSKEASLSSSSSSSSLQWFVLSATGRSVGSGTSPNPSWLQLMGQHMRPTVLLDPNDTTTTIQTTSSTGDKSDGQVQVDEILNQQERFYKALTSGNLKEMEAIFGKDDDGEDDSLNAHYTESDAVTNVIKDGGRLDAWKTCLEDGARPAGLVYGNADVTILDNTEEDDVVCYSSCVEFPAMEDMAKAKNSNMAATPTLLAVQKWSRRSLSSSSKSESSSSWKLVQHQTIPWTDDRPALGTLICDCRGCVSLVRGGSGG